MEQTAIEYDGEFKTHQGKEIHPQFYPTPARLAAKMAGMISGAGGSVLEPSAGNGALAEAIKGRFSGRWGSVDTAPDCIEIMPDLQAILRDKGMPIVGSDFMQFNGVKQYDAVVMNPPFSHGVRHVLKAWQILYAGEIIALLNAETLRNPHTKGRQILAKIIKDNKGTVEYLADQFIDSERKTSVEVALIHIKKDRKVEFNYFDGMKEADPEAMADADGPEVNQVALTGSQIANKVRAFNKALDCHKKAIISRAEGHHYAQLLTEGKERREGVKDFTEIVKKKINKVVAGLQEKAWRHIAALSEFRDHMTTKVAMDFELSMAQVMKLEFTEENIRQFLLNLLADRGKIFNDGLLEVFDELTRYHKDNRVHVEGWKSDDYFFVNKRIVLPYVMNFNYGKFQWSYHGGRHQIHDLDRIMSYMMGHDPKGDLTIQDAVDSYDEKLGTKMESTHFSIRVFKKGTMHLYFRDLDALQRFNLAAGRLRGWLPKEDEKVPKEFWLMND